MHHVRPRRGARRGRGLVQPRAGRTRGRAGRRGAADRPDRRDRQLPGPLDDRHRPLGARRAPRSWRSTRTPATTAGPQEIEGFEDEAAVDSKVFLANLERAGVRDRVTYVRKFSHDALDDVRRAHRPAAHRRRPPLRAGERRHRQLGRPGGRRRVDADPRLVLVGGGHAGPGDQARLLGPLALRRPQPLAGRVRREPVSGTARLANVGRQLAQLPWFARNLAIKALIVAKLPKATRLLGHSGENWPY